MGKKAKGKKADDDWEAEADAIAHEAAVVAEAAAAEAAGRKRGELLEALFVDLIARGLASEADCDKATDELADGAKTEDQLVAEWQAKADKAASFDRLYGHAGEEEEPEPEPKGPKSRRWRQEEGGSRILDDVVETPEEIQAKLRLHAEIFGTPGSAHAYDHSADGHDEHKRMTLSQLSLGDWRNAASDPPKALPLAGMTGVCLFGGSYGLSTHGDKVVRLWDLGSGRRLAAHQQKLDLTALAAANGIVAVGDAGGAVHLYGTDATFAPLRLSPLPPAAGAVHDLALLFFFEQSADPFVLVLASYAGGVVTASLAHTKPWPPPRADSVSRVTLPMPELGHGAISLAAARGGQVFGAAGSSVAFYDLEAPLKHWTTRGGEWPIAAAAWHAICPTPDAIDGLVDSFAAIRVLEATRPGVEADGELPSPPPPPAPPVTPSSSSKPERGGGGGGGGGGSTAATKPPEGVSQPPPVTALSHKLSYSPVWQLVVAALDGDLVAIWDVRRPAADGPAATLRVAGGASWVHVDEGHEYAGHLLLAPSSGGPVQLFDVRRVPLTRSAVAVRALATFAPPAASASCCFAAAASSIVVGGGAESSDAWRYSGEPEEAEEEKRQKDKKDKKKRLVRTNNNRMFNRTK